MSDENENAESQFDTGVDREGENPEVESEANARIDLDDVISEVDRESVLRHEREAPPETEIDKVFRWSTAGIGILLLATVAIVVALQFLSVAEDSNRSIDQMLAYFEQGGMKVAETHPLTDTAGAQWAQSAQINGQTVRIYRFAPDISAEQKQRLESVKSAGKIQIDGKAVPAKINGPFVLTGYEENSRKDDLLTAFSGFGAFTN